MPPDDPAPTLEDRAPAPVRRSGVDQADPDAAAVARVLAGDVEAFGAIVERWQGPLLRLALRYTGERTLAEDLVQESFLRAFRGLTGWRGRARFSTWLIALSTNVLRSNARRPLPPEPLGERDPAGPLEVPGGGAESEASERVRRAVNALPARYRDALHLYYFHSTNLSAAAASLHVPEGTLKARLARGRRLLERLLTARTRREP